MVALMELPGDRVTVDDGLELVEGTVTRLAQDCVWVRVERSGIEVPASHGGAAGYRLVPQRATAPSLVFETSTGSVELSPSCFVVFVDETGHEEFRDPRYPLFGLGGCAVEAGHFQRLIDAPWRYMKDRWFDGEDTPLHAADLRSPTSEQLEALVHFFTRFQFCRVAAVLTAESELNVEMPPYQLAASALMQRIVDVAQYRRFDSVALVIEASQRADRLAQRHFAAFSAFEGERDGKPFEAPITKLIAPKSLVSAMEVADFVMHAAGGRVRTRLRAGGKPRPRDFDAVFRRVDKRLTSFMEVTSVTSVPEPVDATRERHVDSGTGSGTPGPE